MRKKYQDQEQDYFDKEEYYDDCEDYSDYDDDDSEDYNSEEDAFIRKSRDYFKSEYDKDKYGIKEDRYSKHHSEEDDEIDSIMNGSSEDDEFLKELDEMDIDEDEDFDDNEDFENEEDKKPKQKKKKTTKKKKQEIPFNPDRIDFSVPKDAKIDHSGTAVRKRFFPIMEDYHSDDEEKQKYALECAMRELEGFIHSILRKYYSTYTKKYFHDLVQEGYVGVAIGMKKYDPNISMPTTFFFPYIRHEIQGFITRNVDKTTSHYSSNIKKINKAIDMLEEKGVQYTNIDIAIQTGMTIETVDQSLSIRNCRDEVHIDACPPNVIDAEMEGSKKKGPEQEFLEKEEKSAIYRTMNTLLTEDEIAILQYHFGLNDVQVISEGEIAKKMQMPKDKVKRVLNCAIRKLRRSELANMYSDNIKKDDIFLDDTEIAMIPREATESDIDFLSQLDSICDDI